jgi:hypothetical protein
MSDSTSDAKNDAPGRDRKLKRKDYERELARRHVEFVKLEQWVVHKCLNAARLSAALAVHVPRWPMRSSGVSLSRPCLLCCSCRPYTSPGSGSKSREKEPEPGLGVGRPRLTSEGRALRAIHGDAATKRVTASQQLASYSQRRRVEPARGGERHFLLRIRHRRALFRCIIIPRSRGREPCLVGRKYS